MMRASNVRRKKMTHSGEIIWGDGVTLEEIWQIYLEAITSKVVDKELPMNRMNRTC